MEFLLFWFMVLALISSLWWVFPIAVAVKTWEKVAAFRDNCEERWVLDSVVIIVILIAVVAVKEGLK